MDSITTTLREAFHGNNHSIAHVLLLAGFTQLSASEFLNVSVRTLRRWELTGQPDKTASKLLAIMAGFLPWPDWYGWELHAGSLFAPGQNKRGMSPQAIEQMIFTYGYRDTLIHENKRLQAELSKLTDKPRAPVLQLVPNRPANPINPGPLPSPYLPEPSTRLR